MAGKLIRVLSTGRTGTMFLSQVFADQGYISYHEDLYVGEPSSAISLYTYMLADLWKQNKDKYFAFESNFARPYINHVAGLLSSTREEEKSTLLDVFKTIGKKTIKKPGYVIHTAHILTPATPLVELELKKVNIESRNLIVFRNPLKTIHALYQVEGGPKLDRPYRLRPLSFSGDDTYIGAANIWGNTYRMAWDQSRYYGPEKYFILELERFSRDLDYARAVFSFIGLEFDSNRFQNLVRNELSKPFRSAKTDSIRNSHLFYNPQFVFAESEIERIRAQISDVFGDYGIDWEECVSEYKKFHADEKIRLGFA